jgi:GDPmannose 4,6-dehydratase
MARALILGATGQDGQFLANLLIGKGYEVLGVSRTIRPFPKNPLSLLRPEFKTLDVSNGNEMKEIVNQFNPDEIYNLAGESSVSKSFMNPVVTVESNVVGLANLLGLVKENRNLRNVRIFQASSAEMFGSSNEKLNENSSFSPVSPYAIAKVAAHKISKSYRDYLNCWVSCGILFNHESEIRSETFVFQKIITSAVAIAQGRQSKLRLGNIEIARDWGHPRDYVDAMWKILQADQPDDFVIATGVAHSLREVILLAFRMLKIEDKLEDLVDIDTSLMRPADISSTCGDTRKIERELGWKATIDFENLVDSLIKFQLEKNDDANFVSPK